jgi:hypothetical protein
MDFGAIQDAENIFSPWWFSCFYDSEIIIKIATSLSYRLVEEQPFIDLNKRVYHI